MTVWLNYNPNYVGAWTRGESLQAADKFGVFAKNDEYILNIEPCSFRTGKVWTGLWHIDVLRDTEYRSYYADCDDVFVSSPVNVQSDKAQVLFQALDVGHHKRTDKEVTDFVICGSMSAPTYNKRIEAYELMKKEFDYLEFATGKPIDEYIKNYSKARVQFIHTGQDREGRGAVAQRFFESLGIGPVLTNWTDDIPLTGLVENEDFMVYRTPQEMVEKMKVLLSDSALRAKIAYNGRRKALLYHTYQHRIMSILNVISDSSSQ